MTQRQINHVEEALIEAMDVIVYALKKGKATPEEIVALPEIAFALNELQKC